MRIAQTVVDLVGGTPLVQLQRMADGLHARVVGKLEYFNPLASVRTG
jgi:cysteine synthase A